MTSFANQATLYVLVFLLATLARAYYITDLKLVSCDATVFACPKFPGYRQIPVNLNAGTSLPSVFLHLKEDLAADPITDIQILRGNETPKPSNVWTRLDTNLNEGSSTEDSSLWLYYTKNTSVSRNPISSIIVKTGSHPEVAAEYRRVPVNLNEGVGGQAMYIYYSQDGPKDPITAITAKSCLTDDCYMEGWERVEKDANEGILIGMRVYLFFQRVPGDPPVTDVVIVVDDQTPPQGYKKVEVDLNAYTLQGASIHLWYQIKENASNEDAVQELAIQYGPSPVTPYGWTKIPVDLNSKGEEGGMGEPVYLFYRRGYPEIPALQPLAFNENGAFKILQLADLHFTNEYGKCRDVPPDMECHGDATTIEQIDRLLDLEKPDLVVFSGDNVDGGGVKDARAATFKFAEKVIQRQIPWATVFGNHDDENDLSREELYEVVRRMPYSLMERGPLGVSGVGNYALQVRSNATLEGQHLFTIYFLDSGAYTDDTKQQYDFIKRDQLEWLRSKSASFTSNSGKPRAMIFFHIPIWEYHEEEGRPNPMLGDKREQVSSPSQGAAMVLDALKAAGDIKVAGCGHDHLNDYCLYRAGVYLCYGGGLGVGGYGAGHLGWPRRARVWQITSWGDSITTWKRLHDDDLTMIDYQTLM